MRGRRLRIAFTFVLCTFLWFHYKFLMGSIESLDIVDYNVKGKVQDDVKADAAKKPNVNEDGQCAFPVQSFRSSLECILPVLDPFNEHVMKFMIGSKDRIDCPGKLHTTYNNGVLTLVEEGTSVKNISVQSIIRQPQTDWGFVLNDKVFNYSQTKSSKINEEFLRVDIEMSSGEKVVEYHAKVVPKPDVLRRETDKELGLNYNVLMVGFDSTSSAQMQRAMPDVYHFLKDDLRSYIFHGYSIVGDGTTPQLTAMLTGETESNLPESRRGYPNASTIDSWPWIFKEYRNHGYATMYSEDDADYNAFNYRLHGFKESPTDHYARTFWQAASTRDFCVQATPQPQLHFSYVESFMEAYQSTPKFALAFLSNICHDSMTNLRRGNDHALRFFKSLKEKGFLNDTILVVFGDHGMRFGEARALIQSKLEERLPFLSITLPISSRHAYKELHSFLEENTEKLTSPFDIHATLRHILTYSQGQINAPKTGMSLFRRIPSNRGCAECGIPEHYCPCVQLKEVSVKHPHVQDAAQGLVDKINDLLTKDELSAKKCAHLKLREIKSAHQNLNHPKVMQFRGSRDIDGRIPKFEKNAKYYECNYHLLIRTAPGDALFEATGQLLDGTFYFGQDISRINKYGDQPECIAKERPYLRQFCFCKGNDI